MYSIACDWHFLKTGLVLALCVFIVPAISPPVLADELKQQFVSPPNDAKPRVWWHWMNGNVSREGIEADLRWMKRIGVGGLHTTDAGLETPVVVDQRIPYMSQAWEDAFAYAAQLADDLDLEFGIFTSPGWSLTGGPWVKPAQAMKKLVWSTASVTGGGHFTGLLPDLPRTTGPFQSMPVGESGLISHSPTEPLPEYGKDTVVIAYRVPQASAGNNDVAAKVVVKGGSIDSEAVLDGNPDTTVQLPLPGNGRPARLKIEFEQAQDIRSVTVSAGPPGTVVNLAASMDGTKYFPVKLFYMGSIAHTTVSMDPVSARYFRFSIKVPQGKVPAWPRTAVPGASFESVKSIFPPQPKASSVTVRDLVLRPSPRVNQFETKAAFQISPNYYAIETPEVPREFAVPTRDVVDLTPYMRSDGYLDWQVPPGNWVIVRLGYSLQGKMNHAASAEGTGLEVDKLNKDHVAQYFKDYLGLYSQERKSPGVKGNVLDSLMMDSYEIGVQNWSDDILLQFQRLRGYDPRPWLPALIGIVVESARDSDRFLWDFRKTLSDLLLENHHKVAADFAKKSGLLLYGEALESARWALGDDMELRRYTDIPTAAMWMFSPENGPGAGYVIDILGAASVAHVYGQNMVAVEALTSAMAPWAHSPRTFKPVMDRAFSLGMNRPIIHTSVHQPLLNTRPGLSLSFFGQYFNRHDTWAELASGWMDYLARCSYLLQQGRYVADVAYFYGEEAPLVSLFSASDSVDVPPGVGFDFINPDALLHHLSVRDGRLVTSGGMSYRFLYLGGSSSKMTLPVLRKLQELVTLGATVVGERPQGSPTLSDDMQEFERLVQALWGPSAADQSTIGQRISGGAQPHSDRAAAVWDGLSVDSTLERLGIERDFEYKTLAGEAALASVHRRLANGDLYFISNRSPTATSVEARFRVSGREAEIWYPETGETRDASYRFEGGRTIVSLDLEPYQSLFVVFRKLANVNHREVPGFNKTTALRLDSGWQLAFQSGGGSPVSISLDRLSSWSEQANEAVKYFSGTAVYRRDVFVEDTWLNPQHRLVLDLGKVRELAQVYVNGDLSATLWTEPYRCDISEKLRPGKNVIEVRVTNLWVNRLIGDSQPGVTPSTATGVPAYEADAPLFESGLFGPVKIERWIPQ